MNQVKTGKFISTLRREAGLTQEALGQKLGVTNKTVSRWENGNYMPDIEMLQILSKTFGVSINEILSGERLNDNALRTEADKNLISAVKNTAFTIKERSKFWTHKWLIDHIALIIIAIVITVAVTVWVWINHNMLVGFCPLLWVGVYVILRNQMMIYVEGKIFSAPEVPDSHDNVV